METTQPVHITPTPVILIVNEMFSKASGPRKESLRSVRHNAKRLRGRTTESDTRLHRSSKSGYRRFSQEYSTSNMLAETRQQTPHSQPPVHHKPRALPRTLGDISFPPERVMNAA